jgi:hypothetical protein
VGIDDMDTFDGVEQIRRAIYDTWLGKAHEQAIRSSLGTRVRKVHYCV